MNDATRDATASLAPPPAPATVRGKLFRKYAVFFAAVVTLALLLNGASEIWFSYREHKAALIRIQHEQAKGAAAKIGEFIKEIENQIGWTTQLPWAASTLDERRFEALRLLRQVPAITELAQLDPAGREQLRVSRSAMGVVGSGADYSKDPKFTDAMAHNIYYGPVYFRRESEPYMTLAVADARRDTGVSVAEVNLKFIWDVVSQIEVGEHGQAYVIDAENRLIAHPDINRVLRYTDMSRLAQVQAARAGAGGLSPDDVQVALDLRGRPVLTAYAPVPPLNWLVFVELPRAEAYAPLYGSIQRSGTLLLAALAFAILAGLVLARKMVGPIQAMRAGAARIGGGDLSLRISIKTGDELEGLADQFNDMAGRLQESYADLEKKVELRTDELARSRDAVQASLARLEQEMDAARALQLGMLPLDFPACTPGQPVDVHALMEPAREVGGDLYDFFYASEHQFCFLVGDVSGKGAAAAMFMARTRSLVRMAAQLWQKTSGNQITPVRIVDAVNHELCQNNRDRMFVTLFLGVLDTKTGVLTYVNAGHLAPCLLHSSGSIEFVNDKPAMPLAVRASAVYQDRSVTLLPGDSVFVFSDGVTEAMNVADELYGNIRLQADLYAASALAPEKMVRAIKAKVDVFTGEVPKFDDVTMLALRWLPAGARLQTSLA